MAPVIVFAHGAGAASSHPWMRSWTARLAVCGAVYTFDYPYMRDGRKTPDRPATLLAAHAEAVAAARQLHPTAPVILAGKSMGGRMSCHRAAQWEAAGDAAVKGVICFGYPLRSSTSGKSRAEIVMQLAAPLLLVQGSRDPLCPLPELRAVLRQRAGPSELHVVEDADHSLVVAKRALASRNETQDDVDARVLLGIQNFLKSHAAPG